MTIGYPHGAGPQRRSFMAIGLAVLGVLATSFLVLWFVAGRVQVSDEMKEATRLAACQREHMMANLPLDGEALIEKACRVVVETPHAAARAECVFAHRDALVTEEGANAVGSECGVVGL
jgi:hypothetical protein